MSRLRRLETTGKIFFVTCNLATGNKPLSPAERDLLLKVIVDARHRLRFRLFAYVVMPNHWHALILPAPPQSIGSVMHPIKRTSALSINHRRRTAGSFWQARFYDRFLRKVRDFHEAVQYIHNNPVLDGLVAHASAWPWSSDGHFRGGKNLLLHPDDLSLPLDPARRI